MIRFECDYHEGCHPKILKMLSENNLLQYPGYGTDGICEKAAALIKKDCGRDDIDIHFLVGGTQTNATVIDAALKPYQGVLAPTTGHICVHEAGAVEACGHKVLEITPKHGKITSSQIKEVVAIHRNDSGREHAVQPAMVYISHPTECGTLYSKNELTEIYGTCRALDIYLFIDGARLGYGLASPQTDVTLKDLAALCDVFYIGGTKCGALFGEAVVISHPELKKDFRYMIKRHGGMLAKGWLLGMQFYALFEDNLIDDIAAGAVDKALRIKKAFLDKGLKMMVDSYTNQQFPIFSDAIAEELSKKYAFEIWEDMGHGEKTCRFCTSWATTDEAVNALISDISAL